MPGSLAPSPWFTALDGTGVTLPGSKLFTYDSGTSTKRDTYQDAALTVPHTNPIIMDANGRAVIYLAATSYKLVLTSANDTDPPTSPIKTVDPVGAVPPSTVDVDVTGIAGENLVAGQGVYLSDGTGGRTAGRWYLWDASDTYSSVTATAVGMMPSDLAIGDSGTIRLVGRVTGLAALTPGALYYISETAGALTATPPTNSRAIATADTTTSVILSPGTPIANASATQSGIVTAGPASQTLGGPKVFAGQVTFSSLPLGVATYFRAPASLVKNASTVFSDFGSMTFNAVANETYLFEFFVKCLAVAAADAKFCLTGPAAPVFVMYGLHSTAGASLTALSEAFGGAVSAAMNGNTEWLRISGRLANGVNAGAVQLQFAQVTSDASNSTAFLESYGYVIRVA
jgi:hypothetical protein